AEAHLKQENTLHYIWKHHHFDRDALRTISGDPVVILDSGALNHDAGPDFLNARIRMGEEQHIGHVELHLRGQDWYRHGHHHDPGYNPVILHVVVEATGKPILRADGSDVPELALGNRIHQEKLQALGQWMVAGSRPACAGLVGELPEDWKHAWMNALGMERMRAKIRELSATVSASNGNFEQVLWEYLAAMLGGPVNREAFREIAVRLPWAVVRKYAGQGLEELHDEGGDGVGDIDGNGHQRKGKHPQQAIWYSDVTRACKCEALLFGVAGLLRGRVPDDPYFRALKTCWQYLQGKHRLDVSPVAMKMHRMRPAAFPGIRLAQLAGLIRMSGSLIEWLDAAKFSEFCGREVAVSGYWEQHSAFGRKRKVGSARPGREILQAVILNVILPLSAVYRTWHGLDRGEGQIRALMETWRAERNRSTRYFTPIGLRARNALQAQGLIRLKKRYCDARKCLECEIGKTAMKRNSIS
ncbi:MAG: DUF2851 family protein, partial [Bacteroidota bacterium]